MIRLMTVSMLFVAVGCGNTPAKVCDRMVEAAESCATADATATATDTTGVDTCEADLEPCSSEDLDLYLAFADCYEADCDILACLVELDGLSAECLGTTGTGETPTAE